MKISYLSNSPLDKKVANSVHVMHMAEAFSCNGHETYLHAKCKSYKDANLYDEYGVKNNFNLVCTNEVRVRFFGPLLYGFLQALKAKLIVKPDICYSRCLLSACFTMQFGMKNILEIHEMPHSIFVKLLYKLLFKHKKLLKIVVISEGLKRDLLDEYKVKKIIVAHDGAKVRQVKLKFLMKNKKEINIGYAGGLREGNGLNLIVELANALPQYQFHIAGGNNWDIKKWHLLQTGKNINWYGKIVPKKISSFLEECDILIAPYQFGPKTEAGRDTVRWMSPLKIFEYMAANKAIIVSKFEVLEEVLNKNNAIFANPDKFDEWKTLLVMLAENNSFREKLGLNAYNELLANYTWHKRAKKVLDDLYLDADPLS